MLKQIRRFFMKGLDIDGDGSISPCEAVERVVSALVFLMWAHQTFLVASVVTALDCTDSIGGRRYLSADTAVACMEGLHLVALIAGVAGAIVYCVGLPLGAFCVLYCGRHRIAAGDASMSSCFGFLLDGYRRDGAAGVVAFEAVLMARKTALALAILVPLPGVGWEVRGVIVTLILVASILLTTAIRPYETALLNAVSAASTVGLLVLQALSTVHGYFHHEAVRIARESASRPGPPSPPPSAH